MFNWKRNISGEWIDWWDVVNIIRPYTSDPFPARRQRYLVPDEDTIRLLLHKSKVWKHSFSDDPDQIEKRTCDDACNLFKGFMAREKLGHILTMVCRINKPDWTNNHEAIGFYSDRRIQFGEPQHGGFPAHHDADIKWVRL